MARERLRWHMSGCDRSIETSRTLAELRATLATDYASPVNGRPDQRLALLILRFGQYAYSQPRRGAAFVLWRVADALYMRLLLHAEITPNIRIGPGLMIPHSARGVVIHGDVEIGINATIFQRVTIASEEGEGATVIGDHARIHPGACILGPLRIGSGVHVGANAVVTKDVPDDAIVFGVPARILL